MQVYSTADCIGIVSMSLKLLNDITIYLLFQSSQFNTDQTNRLGSHKLYRDLSSKMWNNAKDLLKYILKRGGRVGQGTMLQNVFWIKTTAKAFV